MDKFFFHSPDRNLFLCIENQLKPQPPQQTVTTSNGFVQLEEEEEEELEERKRQQEEKEEDEDLFGTKPAQTSKQ